MNDFFEDKMIDASFRRVDINREGFSVTFRVEWDQGRTDLAKKLQFLDFKDVPDGSICGHTLWKTQIKSDTGAGGIELGAVEAGGGDGRSSLRTSSASVSDTDPSVSLRRESSSDTGDYEFVSKDEAKLDSVSHIDTKVARLESIGVAAYIDRISKFYTVEKFAQMSYDGSGFLDREEVENEYRTRTDTGLAKHLLPDDYVRVLNLWKDLGNRTPKPLSQTRKKFTGLELCNRLGGVALTAAEKMILAYKMKEDMRTFDHYNCIIRLLKSARGLAMEYMVFWSYHFLHLAEFDRECKFVNNFYPSFVVDEESFTQNIDNYSTEYEQRVYALFSPPICRAVTVYNAKKAGKTAAPEGEATKAVISRQCIKEEEELMKANVEYRSIRSDKTSSGSSKIAARERVQEATEAAHNAREGADETLAIYYENLEATRKSFIDDKKDFEEMTFDVYNTQTNRLIHALRLVTTYKDHADTIHKGQIVLTKELNTLLIGLPRDDFTVWDHSPSVDDGGAVDSGGDADGAGFIESEAMTAEQNAVWLEQEKAQKVETLVTQYPKISQDLIVEVLGSVGGDLERAMEELANHPPAPQRKKKSIATAAADGAVSISTESDETDVEGDYGVALENLIASFQGIPRDRIVEVLKASGGHGGQAAAMLRKGGDAGLFTARQRQQFTSNRGDDQSAYEKDVDAEQLANHPPASRRKKTSIATAKLQQENATMMVSLMRDLANDAGQSEWEYGGETSPYRTKIGTVPSSEDWIKLKNKCNMLANEVMRGYVADTGSESVNRTEHALMYSDLSNSEAPSLEYIFGLASNVFVFPPIPNPDGGVKEVKSVAELLKAQQELMPRVHDAFTEAKSVLSPSSACRWENRKTNRLVPTIKAARQDAATKVIRFEKFVAMYAELHDSVYGAYLKHVVIPAIVPRIPRTMDLVTKALEAFQGQEQTENSYSRVDDRHKRTTELKKIDSLIKSAENSLHSRDTVMSLVDTFLDIEAEIV